MGKRGPKPGDVGYRAPLSLLERLEPYTTFRDDGCWEHVAPRNHKGYVRITFGSRLDGSASPQYIHRLSYAEFVGDLDPELTIDHLCENKACWRPDHLEQVTNAENKKRGGDRMTHCRRGHPRNEVNTYVKADGKRQCRPCKRGDYPAALR
jgi:hypothetical protein